MADTKISALDAATTLAGPEVVAGVQAGGNVKISGDQLAALALGPALNSLSAIGSLTSAAKIPAYQSGAGSITVEQLVSAAKQLGLWYNLGVTASAVSVTGTTAETVLGTVTIPAGSLGSNGALRLLVNYSFTSSAESKTLRVRLGGAAGTLAYAAAFTTQTGYSMLMTIIARNSNSSQLLGLATGSTGGLGLPGTGTWPNVATINMASTQTLVFAGVLNSAAQSITLEGYSVEALYQA